jgi:hypothetical protein
VTRTPRPQLEASACIRTTPRPRYVPPDTFAPLQQAAHEASARPRVESDPVRDDLLIEYRRRFRDMFLHDVRYNLATLREWHERIARGRGPSSQGLTRLHRLARTLQETDPWASTKKEMEHEGTAQNFYYTALTVGHALLRAERGQADHGSRTVPCLAQRLVNELERAVPGPLVAGPWRGLLPTLWYHESRKAIPALPFRRKGFFDRTHQVLEQGVFRRLTPGQGPVVERYDPAGTFSDPAFFEPGSHRTRHNVILAISHRHPTYDLPVLADILQDRPWGVWATGLYMPPAAARDPEFVLVFPGKRKSLDTALVRSAAILEDARLPLLIAVDGIPPNLLYGQQPRIKRGIRVLVDFLQARAGRGRRNFILPISLDDTVGFIQGRDPSIRVTVHPPICLDDVAEPPSRPRPNQLNWGDPLLSHLECLFLTHTGQVRHGWHTPCVATAARAVARARRGRLPRLFAPSLLDLCRLGQPAAAGS